MSKNKDHTGKVYGRLTALSVLGFRENGAVVWKCLCKCGKICETTSAQLTSGGTKSCGCLRINDLTGQRFGRLLVISLYSLGKGGSKWNCLCDCGNYTTPFATSLKEGTSKSCGCLKSELQRKVCRRGLRPYETSYNRLIRHANHKVSLTYEDFLEFVKIKNCHYCNAPIEWIEYNGTVGYNLDRKNNNVGYKKENCLVCCKVCNCMKHTLTYEMFFDKVLHIYNKMRENGN